MILQLQPLKFTVVYKKGKYMYLADTLSRAALNRPTPSDPQEEVFQCNSEDALEMFRVELETMELDSLTCILAPWRKLKLKPRRILPCQSNVYVRGPWLALRQITGAHSTPSLLSVKG